MIRSTFILCSLLSFSIWGYELKDYQRAPKNMSSAARIIKKYKAKDLTKNLRDFVGCCRPSRMAGSPGHAKSAPFLIEAIKNADKRGKGILTIDPFNPKIEEAINIYQSDFDTLIKGKYKPNDPTYKRWDGMTKDMVAFFKRLKGVKGKNIIWEKKGTTLPEEVLIVGAHYDTIGHHADTLRLNPNSAQPGADDNGSGVSIALALIKVLSELDNPRTVRIVFFDFEEAGFLGSQAYVEKYKGQLKSEKFAGYLNLEMLGNDTKKYDKTRRYGNMKAYIRKPSENGHQEDDAFAKMLIHKGSKVTRKVKFDIFPNSFNSSDHIHFWAAGFPAVTFSQDWENDFNKRYHTSNDFVETLNLKTLFGSFQYIAGAVVGWSFGLQK